MVQAIWGIVSIAATLAGLGSAWRKDPSQRRVLLISFLLFLALIGTSEITFRIVVYERTVSKVQVDIRKVVGQQARSAEDIREELTADSSILDEALSRCVEDGTVEQKTEPVVLSNGESTKVRLYYAAPRSQAINENGH